MTDTRAAEERKLKVFISYSRKDVIFAQRIVAALDARGLAPKIDTRDLQKLEDWRRELLGFIHEADAIVFIASPNSISSAVCSWEVEREGSLADFKRPRTYHFLTELPRNETGKVMRTALVEQGRASIMN
jgi:acyl-CoA synthetase (AMP-forming)/AMP-acid ligase II